MRKLYYAEYTTHYIKYDHLDSREKIQTDKKQSSNNSLNDLEDCESHTCHFQRCKLINRDAERSKIMY